MRITKLTIKNFRALADVEATFQPRCNVVVGPNAVGKTTLLDAIRLAKALLAPRTQTESSQILFALGAMNPQVQNALFPSAITNDPKEPLSISCGIQFNPAELAVLEDPASIAAIATQLMLGRMGRQFAPQVELIGILSSPQGIQTLQAFDREVREAISDIKSGKREAHLQLRMDARTAQITSDDQISPVLVGFLDRKLPPNRTIFSYFPADRAIPTQDQPVQIGPGDAGSQLESHNSQPQLKYARLKNTIFNAVVSGKEAEQRDQFKAIFARILKDRSLLEVRVSEQGMLKIEVQDDESKRRFGIEAMSSGEKGLILTCLIIAQTLDRGGIVLLDEPELHLNPAVCKEVLNFLVEEYAEPNDLQLIICSHSPEVLRVAFDRSDCELYHLISGKILTPVRKQDLEEVEEALVRLGASTSESLLYKGTVFVEGDSDSEVLEQGFKSLLRRYVVRDLGGRKNIEKEVEFLQAHERPSEQAFKTLFILDNDGQPTPLNDSATVKVLQWKRRCLENYLLDFDVLTDISKDAALVENRITNITTLQQTLKEMAFAQIDELAFWLIFNEYLSGNLSVKPREVKGKSFAELSELTFGRIKAIRDQYSALDEIVWKQDFISSCEKKKSQLEEAWQVTWRDECNGKRLIRDFYAAIKPKESLSRFKVRIISKMEATRSETWRAMESLLVEKMMWSK